MKHMKNFLLSLCAIVVLGFAAGCGKEKSPIIEEPGSELEKSGIITANETWTGNNVYILKRKVVVGEGVILTIEPGTIVKGAKGEAEEASALVVDQGGKLIANGTADK